MIHVPIATCFFVDNGKWTIVLPGLFTTRRVSEGPATKFLAHASGYEMQFASELFFVISTAVARYNENSIYDE